MQEKARFTVRVTGERALFTRPDLRTERYTYETITPSSAKGLLEAVYWHPGVTWVIDRIHVLKPIQMQSIVVNEVKVFGSNRDIRAAYAGKDIRPILLTGANRTQRRQTILRDVDYIIECHFETDPMMIDEESQDKADAKVASIFARRLHNGEYHHTPCLGMKEFEAVITPWEGPIPQSCYFGTKEYDMGLMTHHFDYTVNPQKPYYFRCVMRDGIIDVSGSEVIK